jgi:hypothetical protein
MQDFQHVAGRFVAWAAERKGFWWLDPRALLGSGCMALDSWMQVSVQQVFGAEGTVIALRALVCS